MTQEQVARAADLTVNAYGKIERGGATPAWPTVRAIATAFGLSMRDFGAEVDKESAATAA